jgi:hypothetical protein
MNLMWAGDQNTAWDQHDGIKSAVSIDKKLSSGMPHHMKCLLTSFYEGDRNALWWIFRLVYHT